VSDAVVKDTTTPEVSTAHSVQKPADPPVDPPRESRSRSRRRRSPGTYLRRLIVITYLFFLVVWPVALVVQKTFDGGLGNLQTALQDAVVTDALQLTLVVALWAVAINTVFGVGISLLLVRYTFWGRGVLSALIDLPLAVSPVVVGLALLLAYGSTNGLFGPTLENAGFQVAFATPGIILATAFVSLPLVIRELVPVLEEIGTEQEQAARSLGAGPVQTFRRVTLPSIKWALVYGVVLSLARSLGEFGAVKVISGNIAQQTQTATLVVEEKYQDFEQGTAYATSFLLALIAVAALVVVTILRPKDDTDGD
jgi:sulfate transport system permease protein